MTNPRQSQKPLQVVFNILAAQFNRPGYFFLKLTAENGAASIQNGGDGSDDDVWVQMPELNNSFMHSYSRINDPIKQKEPGQPVAVGDGKFTFFLSREFLQHGKKEDVCIWVEAFEFLDLNDDDKLKKIGETKYRLFADNAVTETNASTITLEHEIKCQVTHAELPIPSDYSQVKNCPGRYVELYKEDAKIRTFNLNLCLASVDVDIRSYDEILERSTRFAPARQTEDGVKNTQHPATPNSSSPSVVLETISSELCNIPVKTVSSVPLSNSPSRLKEFGSSLLNKVTRKERLDKGLSETVRRLQCLKADTANLVGLLPLGIRQIEFGVNAIIGSALPAMAPALVCGSPISLSNNNANGSSCIPIPLAAETSGLHTPGTDAVDEEVRNVTGIESRRLAPSHMSGASSVDPQASNDLSERLHSQLEELDKYRITASKLTEEIESLRHKITALEVQNQQLKRQGSRCLDCNGLSPSRANCSIQTELPSSRMISGGVSAKDEQELARKIKHKAFEDVQLGKQMTQMEKTYEQQLAVLKHLQEKSGTADQTADSLMDEIKTMLKKQKEMSSDSSTATDFDWLYLLEKLNCAQSRIESLEQQLHENAKKWGKEKSVYQLRLLESEKGLPRPLSPETTLKSLKWDMRRATFGFKITHRLNSKTKVTDCKPKSSTTVKAHSAQRSNKQGRRR